MGAHSSCGLAATSQQRREAAAAPCLPTSPPGRSLVSHETHKRIEKGILGNAA